MGELCSSYGEIKQIFWDVNVLEWGEKEVNEMIHSLQPAAIINDRGPGPRDFKTPERHVPDGKQFNTPTMAVRTMKQIVEDGVIGEIKAIWVRHFVGRGGEFYYHDWHGTRDKTIIVIIPLLGQKAD